MPDREEMTPSAENAGAVSVMALELRGSLLAAQGKIDEAKRAFADAAGIVVRHERVLVTEHRAFNFAEAELKPLPLRVVQMTAPENDLVPLLGLAVQADTEPDKSRIAVERGQNPWRSHALDIEGQ